MTARVSWERDAIDELRAALGSRVSIEPTHGMSGSNRVAPGDWRLKVLQQFQFGDLRYETDNTRIVVEVESGGGLTNLVKYWPMLGRELGDKRFVLTHLFRVVSESDYIAHRKLWDFLIERMREEGQVRGYSWPDDWEARLFTYGHASASTGMAAAADFIAKSLSTAPTRG
jgi:hypothetical protein